jgi:hypothetical protein
LIVDDDCRDARITELVNVGHDVGDSKRISNVATDKCEFHPACSKRRNLPPGTGVMCWWKNKGRTC